MRWSRLGAFVLALVLTLAVSAVPAASATDIPLDVPVLAVDLTPDLAMGVAVVVESYVNVSTITVQSATSRMISGVALKTDGRCTLYQREVPYHLLNFRL